MSKFKDMTKEELKQEFIKWFGEEKWEEQEIIDFLEGIVCDVCREYLGISPVPVVFEKIKGNIAAFDNKLLFIKVNPDYKNDQIMLVSSIVHELEHYYQLLYVSNFDTPKARRWKYNLQHYIGEDDPYNNLRQEIEIDAEAFAVVILDCEFGIPYENPDPEIQALIRDYIRSGKLTEM